MAAISQERSRRKCGVPHRPVEDAGKLLGDLAMVAAMLDGIVCGWRPPSEACYLKRVVCRHNSVVP